MQGSKREQHTAHIWVEFYLARCFILPLPSLLQPTINLDKFASFCYVKAVPTILQ
jgi:hypothetical protein